MKHKNEARMSNDARIAVLEANMLNIHTILLEFKQDMKYGFEKIDQRFEKIDQRFEKIDQRFEKIDQRFEKIDQRFEKIDQRFEKLDQRFEKIDKQFENIDNKFDQKIDGLRSFIWANFLWLMGMIIGVTGLIAHTQHWI